MLRKLFSESPDARRGFFRRLMGAAVVAPAVGAVGAMPAAAQGQGRAASTGLAPLPNYARAQNYRSKKQSSYDKTGGNSDRWPIPPGETKVVFDDQGAGVITHIWYTIAAQGMFHLKELVMRVYYEGNSKPSVETPIGDFFGLNLGDYCLYESEYLSVSPGKSLNSYFAMPYRKACKITVENQGRTPVGSFYSNIDYLNVDSLPADTLYFHAQYRQAAPCTPRTTDWNTNGDANKLLNPDGRDNYVYMETRGRGHLMGVTLGVQQNQEHWMGEGDDMIFIDDESKPAIIGTGSEDYFLGSWNFGGRENAKAFGYHQYGAQHISLPERVGGRYLCYRFHGDNPVTYTRYLKHTMEHGHANHRADNFYSCCYWYQDSPYTDFPALPAVADRVPRLKATGGPNSPRP